MSTAASIYFYQHHTPLGPSRVYRVTQLRTDGVHCREFVGTGPVVLKVLRETGAAFASPWTKCCCAPLFSQTHCWYKVSMFKLSGVYQNTSTAVLLYCFVEPFFPPTYGLYKCKESSVHRKISSVVCQNIVPSAILLYYTVFSPPTYACTNKCKEFSAHGTVVFKNITITAVLRTCFPPPPTSACTSVKSHTSDNS